MKSEHVLDVCEIFYSLQGESTRAGLPCIFIRLSGCNLSCTWCDTVYATEESHAMTMEAILEHISNFDCRLVEITGGEPLLQNATIDLAQALIDRNYQVMVETNGSLDIQHLPKRCIKIVDVKCPSSNHEHSFLLDNLKHLAPNDELKFVIAQKEDYDFARTFLKSHAINLPGAHIHLSPVWGQVFPEQLAQWIINDNLDVRLSLQLHKIIWDPETRGV